MSEGNDKVEDEPKAENYTMAEIIENHGAVGGASIVAKAAFLRGEKSKWDGCIEGKGNLKGVENKNSVSGRYYGKISPGRKNQKVDGKPDGSPTGLLFTLGVEHVDVIAIVALARKAQSDMAGNDKFPESAAKLCDSVMALKSERKGGGTRDTNKMLAVVDFGAIDKAAK